MTTSNTTADDFSDCEDGESSEQAKARARLRKLILQRGITPITVDQLRAMGDLWPENENVMISCSGSRVATRRKSPGSVG